MIHPLSRSKSSEPQECPTNAPDRKTKKRPREVSLGGERRPLTAAAQYFPALRTGRLEPGSLQPHGQAWA
ncbi:hypothetical protein N7471_011351 [Penicillium samsonianum]|uniref:uncharacterized protein n=1 Tax=Penicillium samsonianum TaxID=1882272 RepID=UPI002546FC23|nr:uncharacterized protein N7471_011351 [Penicillium samsonianum]KAJ6124034.1 hypothetical protein N7471_011351 [Penicillium samsonianum]